MTIIVEISKPFWIKPERYESELLIRYWWLCFAVSFLKIPFRQFCETSMRWES